MSDDLKLGIDVSADLSKLDTSLQRAEQKVAASGQRMQKSATFTPSIGVGGSMTGSGAGFQSAMHPNAVSFSSLNANGGAFGAFKGSQFTGSSLRVRKQSSSGEVEEEEGGGGGKGGLGSMASVLRSGWAKGLAGAAAVIGAFNVGTDATEIIRMNNYAKSASRDGSDRNAAFFMAKQEQAWQSIPLIGGTLVSIARALPFNRKLGTGVNWQATSNAEEEARQLQSQNAGGMFGGGLGGRRRQIQNEAQLNSDELRRMRADKAHRDAIPAWLDQVKIQQSREIGELDIESEQRDRNFASSINQMKMRTIGLGKYADIMQINRSYDEKIAKAKGNLVTHHRKDFFGNDVTYTTGIAGDDPSVIANLKKLQSATVMAEIMSGLQPSQEISISGSGAALAQGSVRMGSLSGQSAELLKQIADNTKQDAVPILGR